MTPTEPLSSPHFSAKELRCHHCDKNGAKQQLFNALEAFRAEVRKVPGFEKASVDVLSGYRCPLSNAITPNAAKSSEHMEGLAADIAVTGMTGAQLEAIARKIPAIHGIGRADHQDYVHIDTRATIAQWCYNREGASIPYFPPKTVLT